MCSHQQLHCTLVRTGRRWPPHFLTACSFPSVFKPPTVIQTLKFIFKLQWSEQLIQLCTSLPSEVCERGRIVQPPSFLTG